MNGCILEAGHTFTDMPDCSLESLCVPPAATVEVSAPGRLNDLHRDGPLSGLRIYTFDRHPHPRQ